MTRSAMHKEIRDGTVGVQLSNRRADRRPPGFAWRR